MKFVVKKITVYDIEKYTKKIKVEFFYYGPKKTINVRIYETFFDLGYKGIGGDIEINNGTLYWFSDVVTDGLFSRMVNQLRIDFIDSETKELIETQKHPIGNDNYLLRSQGGIISKNNIWVIGDSNTYNYFSKFEYGKNDFEINNKVIIPIDIPELSVNRFVNRDIRKFINNLPIIDGDEIIFILGEIDCRVSFYRNAELKGISTIKNISNIVDRYVEKINLLKEEFKNIDIKISLPNPAFKEGLIDKIDEFLSKTNRYDRLYIRRYFEDYLTDKCHTNNIECLNLTDGFQDEHGFMRTEILEKNDTHNKPTDIIMNNLKKYYGTID